MNENSRIPKDFNEWPEALMSNYDGRINRSVEESIKGNALYAQYAGWHFCGQVWFQEEKWCCEVWCYGGWRETVVADTLEDIMSQVCDKYGSE